MKAAIVLVFLFCLCALQAQTFNNRPLSEPTDTLLRKQQLPDTSIIEKAAWLQLVISTNSSNVTAGEMIGAELSFSVRRNHLAISAGFEFKKGGLWTISSFWALAGYSLYFSWLEALISGGAGVFNSGYSPEFGEPYINRGSSILPGIVARIEILFHLPWVLGIGTNITGAYSSKVRYVSLGFFAAFGNWN